MNLGDGLAPRRFDGIRLPAPSRDEEFGAPVIVYDAAGNPVATLSADEWRALHVTHRCAHGYEHCYACRHARLGAAAKAAATTSA